MRWVFDFPGLSWFQSADFVPIVLFLSLALGLPSLRVLNFHLHPGVEKVNKLPQSNTQTHVVVIKRGESHMVSLSLSSGVLAALSDSLPRPSSVNILATQQFIYVPGMQSQSTEYQEEGEPQFEGEFGGV